MTAKYADRLARQASELVIEVRDNDPEIVGQYLAGLDRGRLEHLAIALAAMVPDDRPLSELLAWCDPNIDRRLRAAEQRAAMKARDEAYVRPLMPCGSHAAYARHKARGETPCDECDQFEKAYQRDRKRISRQVAS